MKLPVNFYFLFLLLIIYGCSSTVRYSESNHNSSELGIASYYSDDFNGRKTASGEVYDMYKLTAAHPTYPFGTIVLVTNIRNGKSVEVRINDRMPPHKNRLIDLSLAAAKKIDMINSGIIEVKIEVLKWGVNKN